ncbi:hypothetical protein KY285_035526 [Solanum tuberosum]|nr:hypothetical protein KY285_035526 [Solanum tuberosum]
MPIKELDTCKLNNLKRCGSTCVMSTNKAILDEIALVRRRSIFCAKYVYNRAQGDAGRTTKDKDGAVLDETSA